MLRRAARERDKLCLPLDAAKGRARKSLPENADDPAATAEIDNAVLRAGAQKMRKQHRVLRKAGGFVVLYEHKPVKEKIVDSLHTLIICYNPNMKKLDFLILGLIVALSLAPLLLLMHGEGDTVRVTQHGELLYSGPLGRDARIEADGCIVVIEDGHAYMAEADCPDGLCLSAGNATRAHPVICLPNEVVISICGESEAYDGLAY